MYGMTRIVNFAHGEMVVGAVLLYYALIPMIGIFPSLLVVFGIVSAFLFLLQNQVFVKIRGKEESTQFVALLAISMILLNTLSLFFGAEVKSVCTPSFDLSGLKVNQAKLFAGATALAAALGLYAFFKFTLIGKAIRAISQNPKAAYLIGLDVDRILKYAFLLVALLITSTSLTFIMDVSPQSAPLITLVGFTVVIVGGVGSVPGTLLAGLMIGISESYVSYFISPLYKSLCCYILLIGILFIRTKS